MNYCKFNVCLEFSGEFFYDVLQAGFILAIWIKAADSGSRSMARSKKHSWRSPILSDPHSEDYDVNYSNGFTSWKFYWTGYYDRFGLYEERVIRLSKALPRVSFLLTIESGTSSDTSWKKYIVNGKSMTLEEEGRKWHEIAWKVPER